MKKLIFFLSITFFITAKAQNTKELQEQLVNVDFSYPFNEISYCSFNNFIINADTKLENENLERLKNDYIKSNFLTKEKIQTNYLKVKSQLTFVWNGEKINIINYKTVDENNQKINLVFCSNSNLNITKIKPILELTNDSFWQFYNSEDDQKYSEINSLKPLVKDATGILDINKLADVLEKNKASLSKYLDN